jgi:hypothetical protein
MTATINRDSAGITRELATGKFTDNMLADMRALIGTDLRTEASINNEYATRTAILRFCEGIGDRRIGRTSAKASRTNRVTTGEHAAQVIIWPVLAKLLPAYPDR